MRRIVSSVLLAVLCSTIVLAEDSSYKIPDWVITDFDSSLAVTWYKTPPKNSEYGNTFSLAIGQRSGAAPWLVLRIACTYSWDRDILLIFKYTVTVDETVYTIRTGFDSVNRTMNYMQKNFSEWYDNYVYPELFTIVERVADSKYASISCRGVNGSTERVIENEEKEKLKTMLSIYKSLGEK